MPNNTERLLLWGPAGYGKMKLLRALAPRAIVLSVGQFASMNDGDILIPDDAKAYENLRAALTGAADAGAPIILRDLPEIYVALRQHVFNAHGWRAEGDGPYRVGDETINTEWRMLQRLILRCESAYITAGAKYTAVTSLTRNYTKQEPTLESRFLDVLAPHLNAAVYLGPITEDDGTCRARLLTGTTDDRWGIGQGNGIGEATSVNLRSILDNA